MKANFRAVAGYAIGWCLTICFVVLLTFIFSFLGTIICAALAGMMVGAARLSRWPSLALSLVFPAVISTVLGLSRAELAGRQIVFLSLLCFGIFWLIYAAVFTLVSHEKIEQRQKAEQPAGRALDPGKSQPLSPNGERSLRSQAHGCQLPRTVGAPSPSRALTLDALQGRWRAEAAGSRAAGSRTMEIDNETVVLSLTDISGEVFVAKAGLKLCAPLPLTLTALPKQLSPDPDTLVSI